MKRKPWILVFLAGFHFLAPIWNVFISSTLLGISVGEYVTLAWNESFGVMFGVFFLFPLAGIAIFLVKRWSYMSYLGCMGYASYMNYQTFQKFPDKMGPGFFAILLVVNIILVSFFLGPAVRRAYTDKALRWWESKPRFMVGFRGQAFNSGEPITCKVEDFSVGGIFIKTEKPLELNSKININIELPRMMLKIKGEVLHTREGKKNGYGIKFVDLDRNTQKQVKDVTRGLLLLGYKYRAPLSPWKEDLKAWSKGFFSNGKGLIPEYETAKTQSH